VLDLRVVLVMGALFIAAGALLLFLSPIREVRELSASSD
jgi:hypothetical protein